MKTKSRYSHCFEGQLFQELKFDIKSASRFLCDIIIFINISLKQFAVLRKDYLEKFYDYKRNNILAISSLQV